MEYDDTSEESISAKTKKTAESLVDLAHSVAAKTKEAAHDSAEKAHAYSDIPATIDSRDIGRLGGRMDRTQTLFEDTIQEIGKEKYAVQARLLDSYQKFLQEQIKVINARMDLASRLKPGA